VAYLVWFWKLIATFLYGYVGKSIIRFVLSLYLGKQAALCAVPTTMHLLHPDSVENFMSMAHDELVNVKELDVEGLKEVINDVR
jgi:hypothetical protein